MRTIGFAGTARNTGKTSTAQAVIKQAHQAGLHIALTSIGFDLENQDSSKGSAAARFVLEIGDAVATAMDCLNTGTAELEIVETTVINTTLGNLVVAKVNKAGTVYVAGANREKDLDELIQKFKNLKVDLLLVDGALNRLVPMIACDGIVLSTGAAFDQDIHKIAEHAAGLVHLFSPGLARSVPSADQKIRLTFADGSITNLSSSSLISSRTLDEITPLLSTSVAMIEIPGACQPLLLKTLLSKEQLIEKSITLTFDNPLKLIACGGLDLWVELLQNPFVTINYWRPLPVRMLTVNPYYLKPRPGTKTFQAGYVDKYFLLRSVRTLLPDFPVYDLFQLPQPDLMRLLDAGTSN